MRSIQATGKSKDLAVFNGLKELGLSIDEVTIEVIQHETKGILGIGAKPAIVVLTEKPASEVVVPDFSKERERPARRDDNRGRNNDRREAHTEADAGGENRQRKPRRDNDRRQSGVEQISETVENALNYTEEAAENEPSAEFVKGLIEKMKIDGKVLAAREEDAVRLRIDCSEMGVLIGHRGETLDAVQYLTSLVINRNRKTDGYTRVTINTEDYREKREETLRRLARRMAQQVKSAGSPKAFEPMNPYERRVIHSALQKNPYVTTYSEGDEPNRRVVVSPKRRTANRTSRSRV